MATIPDLLYVALFAVALPLWDSLVYWPAFHRQARADPARARPRLWRGAIAGAWALVAVGAALWAANDRSWASFGFTVPDGWRLWTSIGLFLLLAGYHAYLHPGSGRTRGAADHLCGAWHHRRAFDRVGSGKAYSGGADNYESDRWRFHDCVMYKDVPPR